MQPVEQLEPVGIGHADVADYDVGPLLTQSRAECCRALEAARPNARAAERLLEHPADRRIVVEDPGLDRLRLNRIDTRSLDHGRSTGSSSVKIVQPGRLEYSMEPCWRRTRSWATAS